MSRAICVHSQMALFLLSSVSARVSGLKYIILLCRAYLQEGVNYVKVLRIQCGGLERLPEFTRSQVL